MKEKCGIVQDLIPLVNDGVASEESKAMVMEHCTTCKECKAYLQEEIPYDEVRLNKKWHKKIRYTMLVITIVLSIFACSFSATMYQFQNFIMIPLIGALGYVLLKKKVYWIYIIILINHIVLEVVFQMENGIIFYTMIYWIFLSIGIVIYRCFRYAWKGE